MRLRTLQPQRKGVAANSSSNVTQDFSRDEATMPQRKEAKRAMTPLGVAIIVNPLYSADFLSFFFLFSFPYCHFVCFSFDFVFFCLFFFSLLVFRCVSVYIRVFFRRLLHIFFTCHPSVWLDCAKPGKRQKMVHRQNNKKGLRGPPLCLLLLSHLLLPYGIFFANLSRRAKFRLVPSLTGCSSLFFPSVFSVKCKSVCSCDDA